jgi:hypothetical protein
MYRLDPAFFLAIDSTPLFFGLFFRSMEASEYRYGLQQRRAMHGGRGIHLFDF